MFLSVRSHAKAAVTEKYCSSRAQMKRHTHEKYFICSDVFVSKKLFRCSSSNSLFVGEEKSLSS